MYGFSCYSACFERTVLVMPSVKRTNSIVSRDEADSGNKARTKSRALRWESALSYDKSMCRISGAMVGSEEDARVRLWRRSKLEVCEAWEFCKARLVTIERGGQGFGRKM